MAIKIGGQTVINDDKTINDSGSMSLQAIAKDISDTAVDVFVYDTSKDSDGGAWRERTQGTSWYNETLNTATRGSRKEFPAVAVIVAESDTVTVYDGDDPDMPMWMVFNKTNGGTGYFSNGDSSAVISTTTSLNGTLAVGYSFAYAFAGLVVINFLSDSATKYNQSSQLGVLNLTISERNNTGASPVIIESVSPLVNYVINDVAMTVLPNAPVDPATGLPVPTTAVATESGVSVITDSGAVYDSSYTDTIKDVAFDKDNTLYYMRRISSYLLSMAEPSEYTAGDGFGTGIASTSKGGQDFDLISARSQTTTAFESGIVASGGSSSTTSPKPLGLYAIDKSNLTNTMSVGIHSDYNTGWMNGDIKLATLSDTDDTNVTGTELVTNGDFANGTTDWSLSGTGASYAVASGQLVITRDGTSAVVRQTLSTVVGETYVLTCDLVGVSGGATMGLELGGSVAASSANLKTYVITHVATSTSTVIEINTYNTVSGTLTVDNLTCRLAEADRSVNGKGLQVFGTVTKNPVATGADLVAYSGFSNSNYLQQPYNSDLDFGTGDFCIMGWFKVNSGVVSQALVLRKTTLNNNLNGYGLDLDGSSRLRLHTRSGSNTDLFSTGSVANGTWTQFVTYRQNGSMYMFLNGVLNASSTGTVRNLDNGTANLTTGFDQVSAGFALTGGSLALMRISATVPTPEQIAKIYNDEKVLFQENAQATLVGDTSTSMNVYALGYDKTTELLHVGTTSGRSVLQGLRRVDNTTDAVGAAISASNGLVAEE